MFHFPPKKLISENNSICKGLFHDPDTCFSLSTKLVWKCRYGSGRLARMSISFSVWWCNTFYIIRYVVLHLALLNFACWELLPRFLYSFLASPENCNKSALEFSDQFHGKRGPVILIYLVPFVLPQPLWEKKVSSSFIRCIDCCTYECSVNIIGYLHRRRCFFW